MNVTTEIQGRSNNIIKVGLTLLPCFLFLYVNAVMMFTLLRKPLLLESPRYILFGILLLTDSLQLVATLMLYAVTLSKVRLITYMCITILLAGIVLLQMSPLILALMSLERYVAICFPLRHSSIATPRVTGTAITVTLALASVDSVTQLLIYLSLGNIKPVFNTVCSRQTVFRVQINVTLNVTFTILLFMFVSIVIVYTYIAILISVKSASSTTSNTKAHKTVLLHLFQLCLCLTSTLFGMISSSNQTSSHQAPHLQYILFVGLLMFPKFLSPLVYGLRDPTFRRVFRYYFTCSFKSSIHPFSRADISNTVTIVE